MERYIEIIEHYENCLATYGDTHKGVDWPNLADMYKRYQVMLDIQKFDQFRSVISPSMLDFGCGTANMFEYMRSNKGYENWTYNGLDISSKFIDVAVEKYPATKFYCVDILKDAFSIVPVDYIVMNGVFTEKRNLSFDEMYSYFTQMLEKVYSLANRGIAFNVMSKAVDWERDDLFHLSLDLLASFLSKKLSRNFIIRNDYGLYEFTTYVYH